MIAALALLLAAAPATEEPVPPVSRWNALPRLAYQADYKPRVTWVQRANALQGSEGCTMPAPVEGIVRLRVPFVVRLDKGGKVLQAQAEMPGCPALARLVEQFAMQQGPKTLQPPEGAGPPFWRASSFLAGWPAAPRIEAEPVADEPQPK
ncbi:hypothetical protein [Sphingomonas jatrophae]|uniref:Uncharacterized protein n=1 Tax=Sphingomonas jatrophae TaxID=1166337 RepID=A0A1I6JZ38_9SPHN|nr:hypothetical protein [Sphingomonas jatrophae]SFR84223.1 hypothetical protein SAMN05192580_1109 [Sphingomonas jatrophae]